MAEKKKTYDQESIKALKGADRVRLRPAVIFGSDGIEGCEHAVFEIISNSIDEAREGYGSKIIVSKNLDGSFSVEDFGRGIPVEFNNAENEYNWRLVFCELYAGGKYNQTEGENYNFALGLNGLGTCATQYASRWMKARIRRDGFEYELSFERGNNTAKDPGFTKTETNKKSGTLITWLPDLDVFTDIDVSMDYLRETLKKQAIVNAGVTFILKEEMTKGKYVEESFCYPEGIRGYVAEEAKNPISSVQYFAKDTAGRDRPDKPEYKLKMSMAFCFTENGGDQEYYHNSSYLEHGGSPLKAVKAAFVYALDKYIKEQGKYLKNESVPSYDDIFDSLFFVSSCFSTSVSYENQTKKAITNKFVEKAMTEFLKEVLARYFAENKVDADRIMNQVLINKRSREEAEKSRVSIKKKLSGTMNVTNKVAKFVDCRSKDPDVRELYIVEGDSALGSCKQARNAEFQALMPIRGKILNCLKSDVARIFKSDIITDLIRVLGCGVEVKTGAKDIPQFDLAKLRYSKVIFCTDADVDGYQIRCLLLMMIYRLCPTLIKEGRVYIAESPLYDITSKGDTFFAYDEKEKAKILKDLKGRPVKIQRSKGLGENDADMMSLTTMAPATRRLIRITMDDAEETARIYEILLGNDLAARKDYIAQNGGRFLSLLDV